MSLAKGKTTSSASRIPEGDAEPTNLTTGTIRMLKNKYGLAVSSMHTVVGETPSTLHWLLQGGKKFVNKDMEGDHWEWVSPDDDTVGEKRKLKDTENDQLSQLELLQEVTQLGSRWKAVQRQNPRAFKIMLLQLELLEEHKTKEEGGNSVQQTTDEPEESQIYANLGTADLCGSAVRNNTAVEAGSSSASRAAAAQVSQKEQSQIYAAE